jgi:L-lysine exporter family protein LysE/ArgO
MTPAFLSGMLLSLSLIMAIGPQNAHVLRVGLQQRHLWITVAVSVVADMVLIALGVAVLAEIGGLSDKLLGAMTGAGAVLLAAYGWRAARRCWIGGAPGMSTTPEIATKPEAVAAGSRRQAALLALALSWLNPHAWLDTAVLIGTASLAYSQPANAVFGLGAAVGSTLWFVGLGVLLSLLGRRLASPGIWRAVDGLVALMMWGTAAWLLASLIK